MANLNAVILPAKVNKDGKHKIRISVSHNGLTRYIPTSIFVDSVTEFKNGRVVKRADAAFLNTKLRGLLQHYQEIIDSLGFTDGFTCPELIFMMKSTETQKHRTLSSIFEEYKNNARIKESTKATYTTQWNAILRYIKGSTLMEHLTPSLILTLDAAFRKEKLCSSTIRGYMLQLKILVNYSVKSGYVSYRINPFASYKFPPARIRDSWLSIEQIKTIRDLKTSKKKLLIWRDLFMLSYYLGGINMVDLKKIQFHDKVKEIKYVRQKTETRGANPIQVQFTIPDEAWAIIKKYRNKNGFIQVTKSTSIRATDSFIRNHTKTMREAVGIPNLIFYSARKSFSQHAFVLGVGESIIDYLLGHSPRSSGSSLISSSSASLIHYRHVLPEQATKAIRKVLDNLN